MQKLRTLGLVVILAMTSFSLTACGGIFDSKDSKLQVAQQAQKKVTDTAADLCDVKPRHINKAEASYIQALFDYSHAWSSLGFTGRQEMVTPVSAAQSSARVCKRAAQIVGAQQQKLPAKK